MGLFLKNIKNFRLNSVFFKILAFSILLMFLSILTVGYISYHSSANLLIDEVKNSNGLVLKQAKDVMDQQLVALDKLTLQISMDKTINKAFFITSEQLENDPGQYAYDYKDIKIYLAQLKTSTDFIENLWVYFKKSQTVVSDQGKYDADFFFKAVYPYDPGNKGNKMFAQSSAFKLLDNSSKNDDYIGFSRTIPINDVDPYGALVVNIKKSVIKNLLLSANDDIHALIYVVDSKGNIILDNGLKDNLNKDNDVFHKFLSEDKSVIELQEGSFNRKLGNKLYTVTMTTSQYNRWKYVSLIPLESVRAKADIIKKTTVIVILISLLIGIILSFILSRRIYDPISKIINFIDLFKDFKVDSAEKSKDELSFINKIVSFVYEEYKNIEGELSKSIPLIREKYISDFFDGNGSSTELDHKEITRVLDFDIQEESLNVVVVFQIENIMSEKLYFEMENNNSLLGIIDLISVNEYFSTIKVWTIKRSKDKLASLINIKLNSGESQEMQEFIKEVIRDFKQKYDVILTVGIGREYRNIGNIKLSYEEALRALEYKIVKGAASVIHIDEVCEANTSIFEYTMEKEQQIINTVKIGNSNSLNRLLEEVFSKNLYREEVLPELVYNLLNALAATAVRITYEVNATMKEIFGEDFNIYKKLNEQRSIEGKKKYIAEIFDKIIQYIIIRRSSQNKNIYERILSFIHDNYATDISLNSVGDSIGLSIQYISTIFKDASGVNFVDYLNTYRIEKAKELLKNSHIAVQEVGYKVGYNNSTNFIRVFKKYERVTPGQYREKNAS